MVDADATKPGCRDRIKTLSIFLSGVFIVIVGIGVWDLFSPGSERVFFGCPLIAIGAAVVCYAIFFADTHEDGNALVVGADPEIRDEDEFDEDFEDHPDLWSIWAAHEDEVATVPDTDRRMEVLYAWHRSIDKRAHDYADMIAGARDLREELTQVQVQTMMRAYFAGYMAGRGWIPVMAAIDESFFLGRNLRDHLRELGLPVDNLTATLGVVMNETLAEIVEFGRQDGEAFEKS